MGTPIFATDPYVPAGATPASPGSQPDIFPAAAYQQPEATGPIINYPSATAGLGPAAAGVAQGIQNYRDQALGKLARIHALIDAGQLDPSAMNSPEVQALFPQAGLDYLEHQKFLPTVQQAKDKTTRAEVQADYNAPGTAGAAKIAGTPTPTERNIQGAGAAITAPVNGQPAPAAVAATGLATNDTAAAQLAAAQSKAELAAKGAAGANRAYDLSPNGVFADRVRNLAAGTFEATLADLRGKYEIAGISKQLQGMAAQIFAGPIANSRQDYERELGAWTAGAQDAADKSVSADKLQGNETPEQIQNIKNNAVAVYAQTHEKPTLDKVMQQNITSTANALHIAPSAVGDALTGITGIENLHPMKSDAPETRELVYGIAKDLKAQGYHDYKAPDGSTIRVTTEQALSAKQGPLADEHQWLVDYLKSSGKITAHANAVTERRTSTPRVTTTTTSEPAPRPFTSYP